jgi:anaerobic selenocysteine-containing dehydrogenase
VFLLPVQVCWDRAQIVSMDSDDESKRTRQNSEAEVDQLTCKMCLHSCSTRVHVTDDGIIK